MIFKDSFRKIFELDDKGCLKMNFKGKLNFNCTNNYKVSGALGHLFSLKKKTQLVSDLAIGEANTIEWYLGNINETSTYTLFLDCNEQAKENNKLVIFQLLTTYVAGDRSWRLRVSTFSRRISNPLETQNAINDIGNSFDQEAATVLIGRLCVDNNFKGHDSKDLLKWIDKTLIHLMTKFAKYSKDNPSTFKLTPKFNYFPQFIFYLRRSSFIQSFNESPDESTYYKYLLLGESVENCIIMIQPLLFEYTADNPTKVPVFLDLSSLKSDCVLLLDTFFHVVVWHGIDVVKWREEGYQDQEGYENIKEMLEEPQEYAQNILEERIPTPKFVSCDYGSGQERLLKSVVNPSSDSKNKLQEEGAISFFSDDVDLKIFMESLKKLAVSS
jgi:protein transport protein SEC23